MGVFEFPRRNIVREGSKKWVSSSSRKSGCLRVPFFEFPEKVGVFEFLFEFRLSSSFLKVGVFEFLPKSGCLRVPSLKVGVFEFLPWAAPLFLVHLKWEFLRRTVIIRYFQMFV